MEPETNMENPGTEDPKPEAPGEETAKPESQPENPPKKNNKGKIITIIVAVVVVAVIVLIYLYYSNGNQLTGTLNIDRTAVEKVVDQPELTVTEDALSEMLPRLDSGIRIDSAKDDAAGLAIDELERSDMIDLEEEDLGDYIRADEQDVRNAADSIDFAETAEGALDSDEGTMLDVVREEATIVDKEVMPVCGNGVCEEGEDATNCRADCA